METAFSCEDVQVARYLLATTPATGHVTPALALAAALVDRGHEVRWYTGRAFAGDVEATGALHCPIVAGHDFGGRTADEIFPELAGLTGIAQVRQWFIRGFIDAAEGALRDCQAILADFPADAVVANPVFVAARWLHELGGPPWATFGDSILATYSRDAAPVGTGLMPMRGPLGHARNRLLNSIHRRFVLRPVSDHYERARARVGLPRLDLSFMETFTSPYLYLQGTVASCEYPRRDLERQVHFVGPFLPRRDESFERPSWWPELDEERPVVLVTQGTVATDPRGLLMPTLTALADEDVLVVAVTGGTAEATAPALAQPLPANARLARFIPFSALLPHVDVMVTNGGYGGTQQALAYGVPLVVAGATEEKPEIAARIAWTGAGTRIRAYPPRPSQLRDAVRAVLTDPSYRRHARRIQSDIVASDAPASASDLLERLAATRRPVLNGGPPGETPVRAIAGPQIDAGRRIPSGALGRLLSRRRTK